MKVLLELGMVEDGILSPVLQGTGLGNTSNFTPLEISQYALVDPDDICHMRNLQN